MEQATIKTIRDAELAAENLEKDALRQKDELLADTRQKAGQDLQEAVSLAKDKARQALDQARQKGDSMQADAVRAVNEQIASLQENAKAKAKQARQLILAQLI